MRPTVRAALPLAAAGAALITLSAPALALPMPDELKVEGPTNVYDQTYKDVKTKITVVRTGDTTSVILDTTGFPAESAGKTFGVHVHVNPCGEKGEDAGPHYQDPNAAPGAPMHDKEIWLDIMVGKDGHARSGTAVPWKVAAKAAGSVMIHALPTNHDDGSAGARNICTTVPF